MTNKTGFCPECDAYTDTLINCPGCGDWFCDACTDSSHDHPDYEYVWEDLDGEDFVQYNDNDTDHTDDPREWHSDEDT